LSSNESKVSTLPGSKAGIAFDYILCLVHWLFLLILAIVLYRNSRQKQKANELLQHQKDEIQKTLAELRLNTGSTHPIRKNGQPWRLTAGIAHEIQKPI
jgi:hypothetical protein